MTHSAYRIIPYCFCDIMLLTVKCKRYHLPVQVLTHIWYNIKRGGTFAQPKYFNKLKNVAYS